MSKLIDELEIALDSLVQKRMGENYESESYNRQRAYEDFFNWLVKKYVEETKNVR